MQTQFTIEIDKEIFDLAQNNAQQKGKNLVNLIKHYIAMLAKERENLGQSEALPEDLAMFAGKIDVPKDFDYKKCIANQMIEKHVIQ